MKLNRYEKVSAVFVVGFVLAVIVFTVNLAIHQGWFMSTYTYHVSVPQVEGIFPGTKVKMGGLKLGSVSAIAIEEDGGFLVSIKVFEKYKNNFTENTEIGYMRPFIIGERIMDVVPSKGKILANKSKIKYVDHFDFIESLNGKKIGPYLDNMKLLVDNLTFLAKAFSERSRSEDLVYMFDQLKPLLTNANQATKELNEMAIQMTQHNNLNTFMANMVVTTNAINGSLDELVAFSKQLPSLGENTTEVMSNLSELTYHMNSLIPTIEALAPELPKASVDALQALQEALVVLQAMQKSFILRGGVKEVQAERKEKKQRDLASEKEDTESAGEHDK